MNLLMWSPYLLILGVGVVSALLTLWLSRHAKARGWLAVPNERSSHRTPTPSGAGLAVAVVFLGTVAVLGITNVIPSAIAWALVVGGMAIAVVGWMDERTPLSLWVRVLVHVFAAVYAVWILGGMPVLFVGAPVLLGAPLGFVLAVAGIVWFSNVYNFMDGIDGLAGMQAVWVSAIAGALIATLAGTGPFTLIVWLLGASVAGFLVWNWHPASIFLGDVGSVLIGFTFGVLALWTEYTHALPLFVWFILLTPFLVDATATTIKRMLDGKQWYAAHREFSYQLALKNRTHARVVVRVLLLNILASPLAIFAAYDPRFVLPAFLIAVVFWTFVWHSVQTRASS
ncbi:hypothetical protein A3B32_00280 [Candidatus Uhrbacteria bacterium RIFCSPLOWO2_01_FULL_53_9]|uniref:Glycosyl transferase n=3 Tax=Candidatus Uhriibacteriota TaxID=1752732 RepID=A0A1F7UY43_9BACT|nr:MAG: hypothetical protein A3C17_02160 [Candidatus Uhrbacteria bacterium RIFCSPHIGHO2_02_FULL_53_13]OGL82684.1 MAG: hypothetical protein A3B32_00280 [Candidatus Uhrbacteria bacterium RIFCSPLOWO2_01_FULL_53_9]OGL89796.1 MAG: hypothetical protein A3I45_04250 [Candidatus Uhrbacteria bacterium RIFCSPLOWO2_02_FULL_53_10]